MDGQNVSVLLAKTTHYRLHKNFSLKAKTYQKELETAKIVKSASLGALYASVG